MVSNVQSLIEQVEADYMKPEGVAKVEVGDTVDVHTRIIEGNKERVQVFTGVVIAMKGRGINETITVRRIVANEGVERVFPVHSPKIAKIEVKRQGHVRRAKLYYLRERVGKARRLKDRRRGLGKARPQPGGGPGDKAAAQSAERAQSEAAATEKAEDQAPVQEEAGRKGTD